MGMPPPRPIGDRCIRLTTGEKIMPPKPPEDRDLNNPKPPPKRPVAPPPRVISYWPSIGENEKPFDLDWKSFILGVCCGVALLALILTVHG